MVEDWQHFLLPYQQAVNELKVKLRGMRKQFEDQAQHSPIEFVTGRVKPVDSIKEKMVRRHVQEDRLEQDMQDIGGLCANLLKISMLWSICSVNGGI